MTDHARAAAFIIADGVLPATEGRGYVLRRLLRHAARHALLLGVDGAVLPAATASVVANLGDVWPELTVHAARIAQVVTAEETRFHRTLRRSSGRLDRAIADARTAGTAVSGEAAFELHDTYGFPVELTVEAAGDAGLAVDRARFDELMDQQRRRARQARYAAGHARDVAAERLPCRGRGWRTGRAGRVAATTAATRIAPRPGVSHLPRGALRAARAG